MGVTSASSFRTIGKRLLLKDIIFNLVPTIIYVYLFLKGTQEILLPSSNSINNNTNNTNNKWRNYSHWLSILLGTFGIYTILKSILLKSLYILYTRKIRRPKKGMMNMNLSTHHSGKWAIVTGASSAIGSAFVTKFASHGLNVCLVGKNEEKLHQLATYIKDQLSNNNKIQVKIMVHDFAKDDIKDFHNSFHLQLGNMIAQYKATGRGGISFLVNCMNYRNEVPCIHHETDGLDMERMVQTNIGGTLEFIGVVLPFLIQQHKVQQRQGSKKNHNLRSAIINVGSHSSYHPTPMMSLYSATNAYRTELMKQYYEEYKAHNIDFLSVTPELMSSNMPRKTQNSAFVRSVSSDRIVNTALRNLGYQSEYFSFLGHAQSTIIPHIMWSHPWHRFLNKMKVARLEMLRNKRLD